MERTYVDRTNTNDLVYTIANQTLNKNMQPQPETEQIMRISDQYENQRRELIIEIKIKDEIDPITNICIDKARYAVDHMTHG